MTKMHAVTNPYVLSAFGIVLGVVLTAILTIMISTHTAYGAMQDKTLENAITISMHTARIEDMEDILKGIQPAVIESSSTVRRMEKDVDKILVILMSENH